MTNFFLTLDKQKTYLQCMSSICLSNLSPLVNVALHSSHENFQPLWVSLWWRFRCCSCLNDFPHSSQMYRCDFIVWAISLCVFRRSFPANFSPQSGHVSSVWWNSFWCLVKCCFCLKSFPHSSQGYLGGSLEWTAIL